MTKPVIFLSAGEPSGDFLGSRLMKAIKQQLQGNITFTGIGGPLMEAEGLTSLFPMEELSLMGLIEILPHIWRIRKRIHETVDFIERTRPQAVITIDAPGFNFRVGKALKKQIQSIPLIHYVAPSVWAWRPGRARNVARFLDHLLTLFPFEPPYFTRENLPATFVGHPVVEIALPNDPSFRARHKISDSVPLLTLLPGSRRQEIFRLMPVFQAAIQLLQKKIPDLQVVIPTLPHLLNEIKSRLTIPATIVTTIDEKFAAFQASQAALAASGTVCLELAVARLPMVIGYKMNFITWQLLKLLVKVKYACLVNILLNREVVPEQLQQACTAEALAQSLEKFFMHETSHENEKIKASLNQVVTLLKPDIILAHGKCFPSQYAAAQICRLMNKTVSTSKSIDKFPAKGGK